MHGLYKREEYWEQLHTLKLHVVVLRYPRLHQLREVVQKYQNRQVAGNLETHFQRLK